MTFVVAIVCGLVGGAVPTRRPLRVERPRLVAVLWFAVIAQLVIVLLPASSREAVSWPVVLGTNACIGTFLVANALRVSAVRVPFALAATGWALNILVVVLNHGMPVSSHAIGGRSLEQAIGPRSGFVFDRVPATADTTLRWLGDVIPVRIGPTLSAVSPGDVLLLVAVALGVATAVRARRAAPVPQTAVAA
jgi:hypothetical protein